MSIALETNITTGMTQRLRLTGWDGLEERTDEDKVDLALAMTPCSGTRLMGTKLVLKSKEVFLISKDVIEVECAYELPEGE